MAAVPCCAVRACLLTERQLHGEQMRTASVAIWPPAAPCPAPERPLGATLPGRAPNGSSRPNPADRERQLQGAPRYLCYLIPAKPRIACARLSTRLRLNLPKNIHDHPPLIQFGKMQVIEPFKELNFGACLIFEYIENRDVSSLILFWDLDAIRT